MDQKKNGPREVDLGGMGTTDSKRPYVSPKAIRLEPEAARRELALRSIPGDAEAQRFMLRIREQIEERAADAPMLSLELRMPLPGETNPAILKLRAERLTLEHLSLLRRYLDLSEALMQVEGLTVHHKASA